MRGGDHKRGIVEIGRAVFVADRLAVQTPTTTVIIVLIFAPSGFVLGIEKIS